MIWTPVTTDWGQCSMPQLLVYGAFSYMTFAAAVDEPWFRDTSYFWRGYPNHPLS